MILSFNGVGLKELCCLWSKCDTSPNRVWAFNKKHVWAS